MTYKELIKNPNYSLIEVLEHTEMKVFVISEFKQNRGWSRIAIASQIIAIMVFTYFLSYSIISEIMGDNTGNLVWLGFGTLFSFTFLIIIHELIHALAYLLVGARHLSFGMQLSKFIFYVLSDKDVINYKQFKVVALAPAIIVSLISLTAMIIFFNQPVFYFFLPIFGLHSLFVSGDFGLLCFFQNRQKLEILTFDVKAEGKTYFYALKR